MITCNTQYIQSMVENDNMAQSYDVTTYLLDKENIRDTLLRMVPPPPFNILKI